MYYFWYGYIKRKYGNKAQLQMTVTDSLLFYCQTDDIYQDMLLSIEMFDTSYYPVDHMLQSDHNKKSLGKMKDETNGQPISEFIGLRSKMYSFTCNNTEEKRAKGVSKVTVKKELKHEHYKSVLFTQTKKVSSMTSLRSHRHELFCENNFKTGLSPFDDKRFLRNSVESYAYSHYKINDGDMKDHSQESSDQINENLSTQLNESHSDQLMDFSLVEDSSNRRMIAHSIQKVDKSLAFENRVYTPIEDESFILNNMKITPCAVNHSQKTSAHLIENPSNQLMLSTVAEDTSGQVVNTTQAQVMTEPLIFDTTAFEPIEDKSFCMDNFKITPCKQNVFNE